jgi:predicted phosphodiesterase
MRVLVVSDIHSNLVALDAVLEAAGPVDRVWHLGDVVGYGPEPDGVVARLVEIGAIGVRGNHDAAACGSIDTSWFNPDARRALEWTIGTIRPATRAWLESLPETRVDAGFAQVHGSLRDPTWEYIFDEAAAAASLARLGGLGVTGGLFGHTHVPAAFRDVVGQGTTGRYGAAGTDLGLDERPTLLNPGSVGQPRDGDPRAAFLILDTEAANATWHRTGYDIGAVEAAMRAAGLPEHLATRLEHGR